MGMSAEATSFVWKYARVSGTHLLVLLAFAQLTRDRSVPFYAVASAKAIARMVRVSPRRVQQVIDELIVDGIIQLHHPGKGRVPNQYVFGAVATKPASVLPTKGIS